MNPSKTFIHQHRVATVVLPVGTPANILDTLIPSSVGRASISNNTITNTQSTYECFAYCSSISIPADGDWWYIEGKQIAGTVSTANQTGFVFGTGFYGTAMSYHGIAVRYNSANSTWYRAAINEANGTITSPTPLISIGSGAVTIRPAVATSIGIINSQKIILDYASMAHHPDFGSAPNILPYGANFQKPTKTLY